MRARAWARAGALLGAIHAHVLFVHFVMLDEGFQVCQRVSSQVEEEEYLEETPSYLYLQAEP